MVTSSSPATTNVFTARTAGRNWIFAIHPSQACKLPVKSRNSRVMQMKNTAADTIRIFRSINLRLIG